MTTESETPKATELRAPRGELRWLIERTYAKGQAAERREFWLGLAPGNAHDNSYLANSEIWTANALEAARFSSQRIATALLYRHFHPEAPVEVCEHLFQCGIAESDELSAVTRERDEAKIVTDEMVERFLRWPLPDTVCADLVATMQGAPNRTGTNLLSFVEARQMLEHVLNYRAQQAKGEG